MLKRKKLRGVFALVMTIMLMLEIFNPMHVDAAENNTTIATAIDISDQGKYVDRVQEKGENNKYYYKYTTSASGYVYFRIAKESMDPTYSPTWYLQVYDSKMNKVDYIVSDNSYEPWPVMVRKGETFYLEVYGSGTGVQDTDFSIQADLTKHENVEIEDNDSAQLATKLDNGKLYLGTVDKEDEDYYKITAAKSGVYTIHFDRHDFTATNSPKWNFALYDSKLNELYEINTEFNEGGFDVDYALAKGKTIFIKIRNYNNAGGSLYELKTTFTAKKNIETEKNDNFSSADKVKLLTTIYGVLAEEGDGDYYLFKAAKTGKYKVSFSLTDYVTYAQQIAIYDSSHNLIKTTNKIYKNASLTFKAKKGKKYYIRVFHAGDGGYNLGRLYRLKVSKK